MKPNRSTFNKLCQALKTYESMNAITVELGLNELINNKRIKMENNKKGADYWDEYDQSRIRMRISNKEYFWIIFGFLCVVALVVLIVKSL